MAGYVIVYMPSTVTLATSTYCFFHYTKTQQRRVKCETTRPVPNGWVCDDGWQ